MRGSDMTPGTYYYIIANDDARRKALAIEADNRFEPEAGSRYEILSNRNRVSSAQLRTRANVDAPNAKGCCKETIPSPPHRASGKVGEEGIVSVFRSESHQ
jgi:hypothetical protein